jgi:hypothetical protein
MLTLRIASGVVRPALPSTSVSRPSVAEAGHEHSTPAAPVSVSGDGSD